MKAVRHFEDKGRWVVEFDPPFIADIGLMTDITQWLGANTPERWQIKSGNTIAFSTETDAILCYVKYT